jgi:hypothetical protein
VVDASAAAAACSAGMSCGGCHGCSTHPRVPSKPWSTLPMPRSITMRILFGAESYRS